MTSEQYTLPVMASPVDKSEERRRFAELQERLPRLFRQIFPEPLEPRTVVVIPSLTLDVEVLSRIAGVQHYEERMLCMLMLLRLPHTRVIFVTSVPLAASVVDYYLHLLTDVPGAHARRRLKLLSCHDASPTPLNQKILHRPRLLRRIRRALGDPQLGHMTCFNVTASERSLAVQLGVPIYGCDPALLDLGSKSGSREIFREAGILIPDGFERLRDGQDIASALAELKRRNPDLRRAAVKLDEGFSGEGNAVFSFDGAPGNGSLEGWACEELPTRLLFETKGMGWELYQEKFRQMGGLVESLIEGEGKRSPSVQCRINPLGEPKVISAHDQVLGGPSGRVFLGCTFPADPEYRMEIQQAGSRVAEVLGGRFGVDFVSVRGDDGRWLHYAIEINLRKGGTTHPFMTLKFLTDGSFDPETGLFRIPTGPARFYYASDNLKSPYYQGLLPEDLIEIAVDNKLHFHGTTQQGVVFHLIGALSEFGKLGVVCVVESIEAAEKLYSDTVVVLDHEARQQASDRGELPASDRGELPARDRGELPAANRGELPAA